MPFCPSQGEASPVVPLLTLDGDLPVEETGLVPHIWSVLCLYLADTEPFCLDMTAVALDLHV
jgi:hypothetical protein